MYNASVTTHDDSKTSAPVPSQADNAAPPPRSCRTLKQSPIHAPKWSVVGGSAIVLLAFALRVWGLNATSLWYDETFVLFHAQQGLLRAVQGLIREDNALPLHGAILALWVQVAGSGEFAARYLSVLLGTAAIPLAQRLSRSISRERATGLGSALACATLPIFVYYSQEVRMYALAVPLVAGFAWASWELLARRRPGPGYEIAYVSLGVLMLLAHLYTALAWVTVGLWGWLSLYAIHEGGASRRADAPHTHRERVRWWRANLLLAALALPIFGWAAKRAALDATAVSAIPTDVLRWIPILFGVGQYFTAPWTTLFVAVAGLSLAAAIAISFATRHYRGGLWQILALTVPIAGLYSLSLVKAKWAERYLLPSWGIAVVVTVGVGWELLLRTRIGKERTSPKQHEAVKGSVHRAVGLGLALIWVTLTLIADARQAQGTWALALRDEWHPRPDFRGVARYIEAHGEGDEAIVVVGGYAASTLDYYYEGPAHLFGLPYGTRVLDTGRVVDLHALDVLERETQGRPRLWLVLWQHHLADPTNLIQSVLIEACQRLPVAAEFTNVWLLRFDLESCRPLDRLARPPVPIEVRFQAPIKLRGYGVIKSAETWEVDLWWESEGDLVADYTVFVHLIRPDGTRIAQHDHIAGADAYPTSRWQPGTRLRDRFFLNVGSDGCPGCLLHVGLYTPEQRLPLESGFETYMRQDCVEIPVG
ncbi:MAG: glycosyltransferase family 39 protein [Anaerolineae bacterium]